MKLTRTLLHTGLLAASLLTITVATAAGDAEKGKAKANTCMGCHGIGHYTNAYPSYRVPLLGGQHPEAIVAALKAYKDGKRNHPTMRAQAISLSEQDMQDIAAYLAGTAKK